VIEANLQLFTLLVDFGLMASVAAFVVKCLRVPDVLKHNKRLNELEVTLQSLIREATVAGNALNQELIDRKNELEKLLMDVEKTVVKLNKARELCQKGFEDLNSTISTAKIEQENLVRVIANSKDISKSLQDFNNENLNHVIPKPPTFGKTVKIKKKKKNLTLKDQVEKEITIQQTSTTFTEPNIDKEPQFKYFTIKT
jgi:ABC-type transporter Mla subunit MlaD